VVFAEQLNEFGVAVTEEMLGVLSLTVTLADAVTGATGGGADGCTQQRSGNFAGLSIGGGGAVVSVTVTCTLKVPALFGVNEKSALLVPCAWPFSVHA
jgi:hypothetical protein